MGRNVVGLYKLVYCAAWCWEHHDAPPHHYRRGGGRLQWGPRLALRRSAGWWPALHICSHSQNQRSRNCSIQQSDNSQSLCENIFTSLQFGNYVFPRIAGNFPHSRIPPSKKMLRRPDGQIPFSILNRIGSGAVDSASNLRTSGHRFKTQHVSFNSLTYVFPWGNLWREAGYLTSWNILGTFPWFRDNADRWKHQDPIVLTGCLHGLGSVQINESTV